MADFHLLEVRLGQILFKLKTTSMVTFTWLCCEELTYMQPLPLGINIEIKAKQLESAPSQMPAQPGFPQPLISLFAHDIQESAKPFEALA